MNQSLNTAFYKTLLESTNAIPWQIDWKTSRYTYVGPQIQELLGWSDDTWATVDDWAERMHPEDRERVVKNCIELSKNGIDHEADYRALKADGTYIWVREVVHVIRYNDETQSLIGFMFDISERKRKKKSWHFHFRFGINLSWKIPDFSKELIWHMSYMMVWVVLWYVL